MRYLLFIFFICYAHYLKADSWAPPKITDYYSSDSTFFVRIFPKHIPDKYSKWWYAPKKKKRKFTAQDTTIVPCYAKMFKKTSTGDSLVWEQKLINPIAPVSAIVSNDGRYLITFDNWSSLGYGVDVMVIYDHNGMLIKRYMLEDISPFPINTYSISISSMWWRCGQKFIDEKNVEICFEDERENKVVRIYNLKEMKIKSEP